jgi:hypothetical protein
MSALIRCWTAYALLWLDGGLATLAERLAADTKACSP